MNLAEAHVTLDLKEGADIESIKRNYRQMAFRYHPDLNPGDPLAKRRFQRLNEAYLLLKQVYAETGKRPAPPPGQKKGPGKKEKPTPEPGKRAKTAYTEAASDDATKTNYYFRREDVLQDLLKDPFAKQVFEDIYRQLHQASAGSGKTSSHTLDLRLGGSKLDLSGGLFSGLRGLLMRQLDDEQTVTVPPASLLPGSKLRVGISQAFEDQAKTVEFTLPKDYVLGQPIRLKGLGRKLGPWKGDLYLRLTLG